MTEQEAKDAIREFLGRALLHNWSDGQEPEFDEIDSDDKSLDEQFTLFQIFAYRVPEEEEKDLEYWDVLLKFPSEFVFHQEGDRDIYVEISNDL